MKTWAYWDTLLESELHSLAEQPPFAPDSPHLLTAEKQARLQVRESGAADSACKVFADTGAWPVMHADLRYAVCERLGCARDLAVLLYVSQGRGSQHTVIRPPDLALTPLPLVWRWFLLEWWQVAAPATVRGMLLQERPRV
jgi:hypothetical protein